MTKEELTKALEDLKKEFKSKEDSLYKEYAFSNNQYKVGDIVADHVGSIEIKKIKVGKVFQKEYSECVYFGVELKKDLTPRKDKSMRDVYQSNLIK